MVNLKALTSSVKPTLQTSTDYGSPITTFLLVFQTHAAFIVWFSNFFSQTFLIVIHIFRYFIATTILFDESIANSVNKLRF